MNDLPNGIIQIKEDSKKALEDHDRKTNQMVSELNEIVQRILNMMKEREKMKKNMEEYINEMIKKWAIKKTNEHQRLLESVSSE